MENEKINRKILELWKNNKNHPGTQLWPLLFPKLKENCVLFIGINPGFKNSYFKKLGFNPKLDFLFSNKKFDVDNEIERENNAKNPKLEKFFYKSYFNPFIKISSKLNMDWEHLDLFFIRETSQSIFKKMVKYNENKMDRFAEDQLNISLDLINNIKPKVVIVSNALASKIINTKMEIDKSNFEENGFDLLIFENKRVPIIFSGMLSGQRALDLGSLRRLTWHIKKAIDWSNKNGKNS